MRAPRDARPTVDVVGLGVVSPIGIGTPSFTAALRQGRSGIRPLPFHDDRLRCRVAAMCPDFDPASVMSRADLDRVPRLVPMALAACREAITMAGLHHPLDAADLDAARAVGLTLGTGGGGIDFTLTQADAFHHDRRQSLWTITNATHGNLAGELSIRLGLHGPSLCVSTGCASSSDAIGLACDLLRSDRPGSPRSMVVVGADAHVRTETIMGMELLGVLTGAGTLRADAARAGMTSTDAPETSAKDTTAPAHDLKPSLAPSPAPDQSSRPFDRRRDGFVLGEGAWAIVLHRREPDQPPSPHRLAEIVGYGATCDAHHRVRPAPDMQESARAMRLAIADAALQPEQIELVQYHGTSTQLNDALETRAVHLAFGPHARRLRGSSIKSMIGHPQGACGAASVVAMIAALRALDAGDPFIPPTINLHEADPDCDLDYTPNHAASTTARHALINCLAFGAKNSALVLNIP